VIMEHKALSPSGLSLTIPSLSSLERASRAPQTPPASDDDNRSDVSESPPAFNKSTVECPPIKLPNPREHIKEESQGASNIQAPSNQTVEEDKTQDPLKKLEELQVYSPKDTCACKGNFLLSLEYLLPGAISVLLAFFLLTCCVGFKALLLSPEPELNPDFLDIKVFAIFLKGFLLLALSLFWLFSRKGVV